MRNIFFFVSYFLLHGLAAYVFFPGLVSPDALFQYAQVKSGEISNLHPPLMIYIWQMIDPHREGPGGIFALYWGLYAIAGYSFIVMATPSYLKRMLIAYLLISPVFLVVLMTIWKDSLFLAVAMLAAAAMIYAVRHRSGFSLVVLVIACFLMAALRHNALLAILPLLYCGWRGIRPHHPHYIAAVFMLVTVSLTAGGTYLVNHLKVTNVRMLPTIAVWDLAGMSLQTGIMLIPSYARHPALTLEDLRESYAPWSNTSLCRYHDEVVGGRMVYCIEQIPLRRGAALREADAIRLTGDWLRAIKAHPDSYIEHRWQLIRLMLGFEDVPTQDGFNLTSMQPSGLSENWYSGPPPASLSMEPFAMPRAEFAFLRDKLKNLRHETLLLHGGPYLALSAVLLLLFLFTQRSNPYYGAGIALLTSGWLIALPLLVIAPNFQIRYLIWPAATAMLALALIRLQPNHATY